MDPQREIDEALERIGRRHGREVYGVVWAGGRPYLIAEDSLADLGVRA